MAVDELKKDCENAVLNIAYHNGFCTGEYKGMCDAVEFALETIRMFRDDTEAIKKQIVAYKESRDNNTPSKFKDIKGNNPLK